MRTSSSIESIETYVRAARTDSVDQRTECVEIDANAYGEALLNAFFAPAGSDLDEEYAERGFYENFEVNPIAVRIDVKSLIGRALLAALGLEMRNDSIGYDAYGDAECWTAVTPTLLSIGDLYFAGYWDGDGSVICGDGSCDEWVSNTDIKDSSYWHEYAFEDPEIFTKITA